LPKCAAGELGYFIFITKKPILSIHIIYSTTHLFCNNANNNNTPKHISMMRLLQHLCFTSNNAEQGQDEKTLTTALSRRAKTLTQAKLEHTTSLLQDSIEQTADTLQSYHIHLIAHSVAAQHTLQQTNIVHERFLVHGREALKIGLYSFFISNLCVLLLFKNRPRAC
jgi:hypothetical protein